MPKPNESLKDDFAPESIHSNWKSKKYQRVALQIRMEKEQEFIKKDEDFRARQMGKDQEKMRKCLERLEQDKKNISNYEPSRNTGDREQIYSRGTSGRSSSMRERRRSSRYSRPQEGGTSSVDPRRSSTRKFSEQAKIADQGQETPPERQSWRQRSLPRSLQNSIKKKTSDLLKSVTDAGSDKTSENPTIPSTALTDQGSDKNIQPTGSFVNQEQGSDIAQGNQSRKGSYENNPLTKEDFQASKRGHRGSYVPHLSKGSSRHNHSLRKSSVAGQSQIFNEDNAEEAQKLYEYAVKCVIDAYKQKSQTPERRSSIPGESQASPLDEISFLTKQSVVTPSEQIPHMSLLDKSALEDLQELLQEARIYRDRKLSDEEHGIHSHNRMQRRRLENMKTILEKLGRQSVTKFDPKAMLECGYLRLSKRNIETLEEMMRDSGEDPDLHAHSDVSNYNVWDS